MDSAGSDAAAGLLASEGVALQLRVRLGAAAGFEARPGAAVEFAARPDAAVEFAVRWDGLAGLESALRPPFQIAKFRRQSQREISSSLSITLSCSGKKTVSRCVHASNRDVAIFLDNLMPFNIPPFG